MVNAQGNLPQQRSEIRRQHLGRRYVHRDDGVSFLHPGLGQPLVEPGKPGSDFFIFQHMGGLAQLPQPPAQSGRAADGVPVRAAVGQNGKMVVFQKKTRRISSRQNLHRVLPLVS